MPPRASTGQAGTPADAAGGRGEPRSGGQPAAGGAGASGGSGPAAPPGRDGGDGAPPALDASTTATDAAAATTWFADDFEAPTLDAKSWSVTKDGSNTVAIASDQAAHGTRSLKLHDEAGSRFALVRVLKLPPPLDQHVFGRAYFRISAPAGGHVAYVWTGNDGDGYPFQDSHYEIGAQQDWHMGWWKGGNEQYGGGGGTIAYGQWFCIQWEAQAKPGLARLWIDGKPLRDFVDGGSRVGSFNQIGLGIRQYQTNNGRTIDMWIDDVAVADQRVPCL